MRAKIKAYNVCLYKPASFWANGILSINTKLIDCNFGIFIKNKEVKRIYSVSIDKVIGEYNIIFNLSKYTYYLYLYSIYAVTYMAPVYIIYGRDRVGINISLEI